VTTPKPVSEADKRAFRSRWRNLFGKLYRRKETVAFLSGAEVKIERLGQTSRELEFSESSRLVRDFLCAGFGVPKALVTPEDAEPGRDKGSDRSAPAADRLAAGLPGVRHDQRAAAAGVRAGLPAGARQPDSH